MFFFALASRSSGGREEMEAKSFLLPAASERGSWSIKAELMKGKGGAGPWAPDSSPGKDTGVQRASALRR